MAMAKEKLMKDNPTTELFSLFMSPKSSPLAPGAELFSWILIAALLPAPTDKVLALYPFCVVPSIVT